MNKKGLVFTRGRDTISFFAGILIAAVGIIPLLNKWGIIGFNVPLLSNLGAEIFVWLVAIFGLYVVVDGMIEPPMHSFHWILIAGGLIFLIVGLIPILNNFGILGFSFGLDLTIYRIVLTLEGLALIIGGLTMH